MPQTPVNLGASPNDGTGDSLRTAFGKVNANFSDLYTAVAGKSAVLHTHAIGDVTGLQPALNGKQPLSTFLTTLSGGAVPSRTALGLGGAAILNVGTTTGTVADGGALAAETIRAQGAESTNATAISNEATRATGAEATKAAKGANSDITSLAGLTTPLSAAQGGTGYSGVSAALDALFSSTQGAILYRGPSAWLGLPPGASGQVLTSGGAGANPSWATTATAASTPSVRQTAYTGPRNADGTPSFLPSTTSGTLTLTAQNVSSTVPLGYTAAQGATNTPNYTTTLTTAPSWTLTASTTNYLFLNASTGASFVSTLQPIYQYGGAASTASNQFTFDYAAMQGYLGNGTTAVATPLVAVGEAVTSSTAVTSTIAYAYNGLYDSGFTATLPANSSLTAKSHNLGVQPSVKRLLIENTTTDQGYAVGDQLSSDGQVLGWSGSYGTPLPLPSTRTVVTFVASGGYLIINKSNGGNNTLTAANWKYKIIAQRGW